MFDFVIIRFTELPSGYGIYNVIDEATLGTTLASHSFLLTSFQLVAFLPNGLLQITW